MLNCKVKYNAPTVIQTPAGFILKNCVPSTFLTFYAYHLYVFASKNIVFRNTE